MRAWDDRSIEILASAHYEAMLSDLKWADADPLVRADLRGRMREAVAALDQAGPLAMVARHESGTIVFLSYIDKGDTVPGLDGHNNRYEAFTCVWWFRLGAARHSGYCQADRWRAESSGNVSRYRALCEVGSLRRMGIDPVSVFVPVQPGVDEGYAPYDAELIAEADAQEKVPA